MEMNDHGGGREDAWRKTRKQALEAQESQAVDNIRRATSVAVIMLSADAMRALRLCASEWTAAANEDSYYEYLDRRMAATKDAYSLVVDAARRDLKMKEGRSGRRFMQLT